MTVSKYRTWAAEQGYLDPAGTLPDDATLAVALGDPPQPPCEVSSVEPYRQIVQDWMEQGVEMMAIWQHLQDWMEQGVEMMAIWQHLQDDYHYSGSYSSVRRFVNKMRHAEPEAFVRVHTAPGEEAQVDFGGVGPLYDPVSGRPRAAHVFVATLSYSRHQYAVMGHTI